MCSKEKAYQGATVIDAKSGMHHGPVATLDFTSLYPSIIIAFNLSYETLILPTGISELRPVISVELSMQTLCADTPDKLGLHVDHVATFNADTKEQTRSAAAALRFLLTHSLDHPQVRAEGGLRRPRCAAADRAAQPAGGTQARQTSHGQGTVLSAASVSLLIADVAPQTQDPLTRSILNGKQLALKISASTIRRLTLSFCLCD